MRILQIDIKLNIIIIYTSENLKPQHKKKYINGITFRHGPLTLILVRRQTPTRSKNNRYPTIPQSASEIPQVEKTERHPRDKMGRIDWGKFPLVWLKGQIAVIKIQRDWGLFRPGFPLDVRIRKFHVRNDTHKTLQHQVQPRWNHSTDQIQVYSAAVKKTHRPHHPMYSIHGSSWQIARKVIHQRHHQIQLHLWRPHRPPPPLPNLNKKHPPTQKVKSGHSRATIHRRKD